MMRIAGALALTAAAACGKAAAPAGSDLETHALALDEIRICPDVIDAAGEPLEVARAAGVPGGATMTVAGPRGSVDVEYAAEKRDGRWAFTRLRARVGGRTVEGLACARAALADRSRAPSAGVIARVERECEAGGTGACLDLGGAYAEGRGVARDPARALALWEGVCKAKVMPACAGQAALLERGDGVPADPARAASLYDRACREHDWRSCAALARLTAEGRGVARDEALAEALLARSCEGGLAEACDALARLRAAR